MTLKAQKTASNAQRAGYALRHLIFSGELAAGSDHLETELAARLGMSRTPVREAVLVLESQGLLEVRPRKGVRIQPVSPDDMRVVYGVLTVLESLAAENAARAGYADDQLAPLARAIEQMDAAMAGDDRKAWALADEQFHRELVHLGGNQRVVDIAERMSDQVRRARTVTLFMRPKPTKSNDDHRAVFEAIQAGDWQAAGRLHRQHREDAKDVLLELLSKFGLSSL